MNPNDFLHYDMWLIFKQGEGYWMQRFLKKGFGHVLLLTKDQYNWIYLDPHKLRLTCGIPPYTVDDNLPKMLKDEGYTVIQVTFFDRDTHKKLRHSRLNNCVSFVKYAMGIKLWAFTPYGLYKKLLRLNKTQRFINGITEVKHV
jgi:hypothetical protein